METDEVTKRIVEEGLVAILELGSAEDLLLAAQALRDGGITAIGFAMTSAGAVEAFGAARGKLGRTVLLGAGAVLAAESARDAIRAGAEFLAGPTLVPAVIQAGRAAHVPVLPGAFTATEILRAWEAGASLVQLVPAGSAGPRYLRELRDALPAIPLMPAGGIALGDVGAFTYAGAAAVGVDAGLVPPDLLKRQAFREISGRVEEVVEAVRRARRQVGRPVIPIQPFFEGSNW